MRRITKTTKRLGLRSEVIVNLTQVRGGGDYQTDAPGSCNTNGLTMIRTYCTTIHWITLHNCAQQ